MQPVLLNVTRCEVGFPVLISNIRRTQGSAIFFSFPDVMGMVLEAV